MLLSAFYFTTHGSASCLCPVVSQGPMREAGRRRPEAPSWPVVGLVILVSMLKKLPEWCHLSGEAVQQSQVSTLSLVGKYFFPLMFFNVYLLTLNVEHFHHFGIIQKKKQFKSKHKNFKLILVLLYTEQNLIWYFSFHKSINSLPSSCVYIVGLALKCTFYSPRECTCHQVLKDSLFPTGKLGPCIKSRLKMLTAIGETLHQYTVVVILCA